jgi:hypothetical protein
LSNIGATCETSFHGKPVRLTWRDHYRLEIVPGGMHRIVDVSRAPDGWVHFYVADRPVKYQLSSSANQ